MITSAPFMSCRDVQDIAGKVIDSQKFAAAESSIRGKLDLAQMPRLADVLVCHDGSLRCEVSGTRETDCEVTRYGLHLRVEGVLALQCQRCLGEVAFDCRIDRRFLLLPPGSEWPEDELTADEYDAIPASQELSLAVLVEDEVLLALPLVPRHEDCSGPDRGLAVVDETSSPFAVLAGLKQH